MYGKAGFGAADCEHAHNYCAFPLRPSCWTGDGLRSHVASSSASAAFCVCRHSAAGRKGHFPPFIIPTSRAQNGDCDSSYLPPLRRIDWSFQYSQLPDTAAAALVGSTLGGLCAVAEQRNRPISMQSQILTRSCFSVPEYAPHQYSADAFKTVASGSVGRTEAMLIRQYDVRRASHVQAASMCQIGFVQL